MTESAHWEEGGRKRLGGWADVTCSPQQAAEHHTGSHSLPTPPILSGTGTEENKNIGNTAWGSREIIIIIITIIIIIIITAIMIIL